MLLFVVSPPCLVCRTSHPKCPRRAPHHLHFHSARQLDCLCVAGILRLSRTQFFVDGRNHGLGYPFRFSRAFGTTNTEPPLVGFVVSFGILSIGGTATTGVGHKTTASEYYAVGGIRSFAHWIHVRLAVFYGSIYTPLPNVSVHVEQPPGIGLFLSHGMDSPLAVVFRPSHLVQLPCSPVNSRRLRAAGVFPFRLCRQPQARPQAKLKAVIPVHVFDRQIQTFPLTT